VHLAPPPRTVAESVFLVLMNGTIDSPPASGLVEYLVNNGARRVTAVVHPLTAEDGDSHLTITYEAGRPPHERALRFPTRPPYTYPLDALVPFRTPRVDGWFAFNNLLCARGLVERRLGRAGHVVYWAVDFVPDRFGRDRAMTRAYDALDAYCCRRADLRVELSRAALEGRDARHGISAGTGAPRVLAPIGAWIDRVPVAPEDGWRSRRAVFIGHLVERMGGDTAIEAIAQLAQRGVDVTLDIAGRGPLEEQLRADVQERGLGQRVRFHGFISDHRELERLLAGAGVALAPYSTRVESFTRYADPSKLKSYLAAGLPILVTDVPPNAHELAEQAGAEVLDDDPAAFAAGIERALAEPRDWARRSAAARAYARQFDWNSIVGNVLAAAGFQA
jgi:glycosyltransferase involved in cell wall biosynthesis